jgi:hypothetical protein
MIDAAIPIVCRRSLGTDRRARGRDLRVSPDKQRRGGREGDGDDRCRHRLSECNAVMDPLLARRIPTVTEYASAAPCLIVRKFGPVQKSGHIQEDVRPPGRDHLRVEWCRNARKPSGRVLPLSVAGAVDETEAGYGRAQRQLLVMRRAGTIPYSCIADNTRWMRKPRTYSGVEDALRQTAYFYRRAVWDDLDDYVEVWCEKDALAGVLHSVTGNTTCRPWWRVSRASLSHTRRRTRSGNRRMGTFITRDFDPSVTWRGTWKKTPVRREFSSGW